MPPISIRDTASVSSSPSHDPDGETGAVATLRVDEFAQAVGLTVRNIRSLNERGLLPPPHVRARVGYYGPEHVERVQLIRSLQGEGLKLDGVKRLLERTGNDTDGLRRVRQAAATPSSDAREIVDAAELTARFDVSEEDAQSARTSAVRLGLLVALADGRLEIPNPALIDAAQEVTRRGMSLPTALRVVEEVSDHAQTMASIFIQAFVEDVLGPFAAAGMPQDDWPRFADAIEHSRPLAAQVVSAVFQLTFDEEINRTLDEISKNLSETDT